MVIIDQQAKELNEIIQSANPYTFSCLSDKGKAIFFPKKGILSQSAEAKGKKINATIGTALEDDGSPMALKSVYSLLNINSKEPFSYAPSPGQPSIRSTWKEMLLQKNPSLADKQFSLPIVSCALTHGLSMGGYLFINEGDTIISPDLYWENYDLIFSHTYGGRIDTFPMFNSNNGFNIPGLREKLEKSPSGKKIVILNFPNNPTGYTVTEEEAHQIKDLLVEMAQKGNNLVVFIDDAYFGLVFKEGVYKESIFSLLCNAHERILAVKFDGPTKEDYVWGFRVGFITFGTAMNSPALYSALEGKIGGAIRGSISNAANISQMMLLGSYKDNSYKNEKVQKFTILKRRYEKINQILEKHTEYAEFFTALPYNSGYFMCVRILSGNAEKVRTILLNKYNTGVIAHKNVIRIAFSSVPLDSIELMFDNIFNAARDERAS
ncbi:MAG TPA: aminotransferase class I/II-fold pyridoxal phosphate-dependent enzyme [Chitinispirillaceae bacterium]|nr:aminotransferase class I/II-fold pyridoxal phosphate-dependent enzyme [Chitinispirillaceae bacterium]